MTLTTKERHQRHQQRIDAIRLQAPCPINCGAKISMTERGVREACAGHNPRQGHLMKRYGKRRCDVCQEKSAILTGGEFSPPTGISIIKISKKLTAEILAKQFMTFRTNKSHK